MYGWCVHYCFVVFVVVFVIFLLLLSLPPLSSSLLLSSLLLPLSSSSLPLSLSRSGSNMPLRDEWREWLDWMECAVVRAYSQPPKAGVGNVRRGPEVAGCGVHVVVVKGGVTAEETPAVRGQRCTPGREKGAGAGVLVRCHDHHRHHPTDHDVIVVVMVSVVQRDGRVGKFGHVPAGRIQRVVVQDDGGRYHA